MGMGLKRQKAHQIANHVSDNVIEIVALGGFKI
jgi:hypothetical protein